MLLSSQEKYKGFSIIELLVAIAVVTIALASILGLAVFSLAASGMARQTAQAAILAQDTMEALRNHRDGVGWNDDDPGDEYDGLGVVAVDTDYYLMQSSDTPPRWKLIQGQETVDGFTRSVIFSNVLRDGNDDIAASGSPDSDTKKATVTVSWTSRGDSREIILTTYLTNWQQ